MGRFISQSALISGGGGGVSFLDGGQILATMSGAIAAGELAMLNESGLITRINPVLPWSAINSDSIGQVPLLAPFNVPNVTMTGQTTATGVGIATRLANGNFVAPIQTSLGVGFVIHTPTGLQAARFVAGAADTSTTVPHVIALGTNGFALVWHVGGALKQRLFDLQGNPRGAASTISSSLVFSGLLPWHGHCVLADGRYALHWSTSSALQAAIYDTTGAIVGSIITVDAAVSGAFFACAPCANGDFLVGCWDNAHTTHKIYRVGSGGAVTWGPFAPSAAGFTFNQPLGALVHPQENRLIELAGGSIAWVLPYTDTYADVFVLNSSGSLLQQVDLGSTFHDPNVCVPICKTPNGFSCAHANNITPNTYISSFDINGECLAQNVLIDQAAHPFGNNGNTRVNCYLTHTGSAIAVTRYGGLNGQIEGRIMHCDHVGGLLGVPANFQPVTGSDMGAPMPIATNDGVVFLPWLAAGSSISLQVAAYKCGRSSVLGAAQSGAADGGQVTILSEGDFTLPATQLFGPGNAFDRRNSTPLGCRGVVGGNKAVLFGWD